MHILEGPSDRECLTLFVDLPSRLEELMDHRHEQAEFLYLWQQSGLTVKKELSHLGALRCRIDADRRTWTVVNHEFVRVDHTLHRAGSSASPDGFYFDPGNLVYKLAVMAVAPDMLRRLGLDCEKKIGDLVEGILGLAWCVHEGPPWPLYEHSGIRVHPSERPLGRTPPPAKDPPPSSAGTPPSSKTPPPSSAGPPPSSVGSWGVCGRGGSLGGSRGELRGLWRAEVGVLGDLGGVFGRFLESLWERSFWKPNTGRRGL